MTTRAQVLAAATPCVLFTQDGDTCGRPGEVGLPAGVCVQHGIAIYRAVHKLIGDQVDSAVQRRKPAAGRASAKTAGRSGSPQVTSPTKARPTPAPSARQAHGGANR